MTNNPIFKDEDDKWYFWDESWSEKHGPYNTREECDTALYKYARYLEGYDDK